MRSLFTVTKNELYRYFASPLAYVYLISFLLLNGAFAFYFGGFFERGIANLDSMFAFQPWLYLIFIPGIAMRLWSEEFRNKTVIQIVTMPVSIATLVWGKFFSAWLFCAIALFLTFPFWITINYLGSPDNLVIFVAYLGSFLTAGCILAISNLMSSLTKNQVISLVLAVFASLLFFLSGIEFILSFFRLFMPLTIVDMISSFSFLTHFDNISKGLVELRDIFFFASIIGLFNFLSTMVISFKTSGTSKLFKSNNPKYYIISSFFILVGFVGINLTANSLLRNIKYDFTGEKLFTLSYSTKSVIENIPEEITIKLYYSEVLGERNHEIRLIFDRVRLLLDEYSNISDGKISYKIYSPKFLDSSEDEAIASNLQPIPIIDANQNAYFGMSLVDSTNKKSVIPMFLLERQDFIEEDITQKIYELYHKRKTVGILSGITISEIATSDNTVAQKWEILNKIEELYDVKMLSSAKSIENIDILMLVHPHTMPKDMIDKIKEFGDNGGKIFMALDSAPEASRNFSTIVNDLIPSDLEGIDEHFGFKFYKQYVVADLQNSITIDATSDYQSSLNFTQDVLQFRVQEQGINRQVIETASLKSILLASSSPLRPISDDVYFIPLLEPSTQSSILPIDVVYNNYQPKDVLKFFKADNHEKYLSARIISKDKNKPFDIIAIGDTDFLYDTFWSKQIFVLDKQYSIPLFDNANFVMNSLDILSNDISLISLRGKSAKVRKFDDIEKLKRDSQKIFSEKESALFDELDKTKLGLEEILQKRTFENRETFSPDELSIIANIRKNIDSLRLELSNIRQNANSATNDIKTILMILNIYAIPLLTILFILIKFMINRTKSRQQGLKINKELLIIALISTLVLGVGILSTYLKNQSSIDDYENKPVFDGFEKNINKVDTIVIKNHNNELAFTKNDDGIWEIKDQENHPVYQERIRYFLSSLINTKFYEKKSAKAEYLKIFGLSPINELDSQTTRIELLDKNKKILEFDIGQYNIDLGRGAKGAYIKFDNKFQVWLINADFIDLSTNYQNWTYSKIWDLRFGRLQELNQKSDPTFISNTMKELLNINLNESLTKDPTAQKETTLNLVNEDNDKVTINIFKQNNEYILGYTFPKTINNQPLEFFSKSSENKFYKINQDDYEKLKKSI